LWLRIFIDSVKSSLHQYAVEVMKLSDNVASNYILSARKCTMIPVLQEAIKRLEVQIGISQEMSEDIKRIQDLESKRTGKSVGIEDALQASVHAYLEKNDPIKRASRILFKKSNVLRRTNQVRHSGNKTIPALEKHQVIARDRGQCTHINDGKRCDNKRWTDIHHIVSRAIACEHLGHLKRVL
jgi:hypothetical protein